MLKITCNQQNADPSLLVLLIKFSIKGIEEGQNQEKFNLINLVDKALNTQETNIASKYYLFKAKVLN